MKCNRTVCEAEANALFVHRDNGKAYCPSCARKINDANPGEPLIPWPSKEALAYQRFQETTAFENHLFGSAVTNDGRYWR